VKGYFCRSNSRSRLWLTRLDVTKIEIAEQDVGGDRTCIAAKYAKAVR
jgi:hypothetical protein